MNILKVQEIQKDSRIQGTMEERKNTSEQIFYYPELDGLRFLAFFLVFVHHQNLFRNVPYLSTLKEFGWVGVDLFFALSAFLFTRLLVAEYNKTQSISFKKFYLRRIFRIWPIYFIFIGFALACFVVLRNGELTRDINIRLIGLLAFSDNIFTAVKGYIPLPWANHLWTIAYEEQFYLFL
ncbi:MAG TPA: acyltransferase [Bacteroidales bacterium]|nr:acyltransferase [Bacteroidales bacterium]HPE23683.1 acyltransferase [Bacteroidales bacterium]HPQ64958.1 acyltransferase [Bacteroidales bacterium]HRW27765.1 acyltransferase [Bacteroidales bacterium]